MRDWISMLLLVWGGLSASPAFGAGVDARLTHFGETLHLELRGRDNWVYDVRKTEEQGRTVYHVQVPALDAASSARLPKIKFPGLESVSVEPGADSSQVLKFSFAKNSRIDHFDYLTDKPSRLIVDFFNDTSAAKPAAKAAAAPAKPAAKAPAAKGRQPASDVLVIGPQGPLQAAVDPLTAAPAEPPPPQTGIFDGADPDFSRFAIQDFEVKESAIIASRQKVYVDFPLLHLKPDELRLLQSKAPVYEIEPKDNDENKQARLLLTLRKNGRAEVFLKTAKWFFDKYPKSQYAEILKFMWADVLYDRWQESRKAEDLDVAVQKYEEAMKEFPDSALNERSQLLIAYSQLERGDALASLQAFQAHSRKFPESANRDLVKIAMAEAYAQLNRGDDALKIYDDVIKNAKRAQDRVRASFLRPDILFQQKKDKEAADAYRKLRDRYPGEYLEYPNAAFNLAAAEFRLGNYRASLDAHLDFVKKFPTHSYSGYALTRVGELLEILGADPSRVMGAFLETYFRYGSTPGAVVARLRMLSSRMRGMKSQELEKAVQDIMKLARDSKLPKMDQFATVMVADGYHDRGEYEKSLNLLRDFYQRNPTTADTDLLNQRIVRNIADEIHSQVEKGEFLKAMRTHQKHSNDWLRNSNRVDVQYDLARAFEQAGVQDEAEKLYRESFNRILALKGTPKEKEVGVFEKVPSTDEILLRMAAVNMNRDQSQLAFNNLKDIKNPEKLTDAQQIERILLAAKLYEQKGEPATAVRYLTELVKAWKGIPVLVAEPYYSLGQMEEKLGQADAAIASYRRVDELMRDSGKVSEKTHARALENMARLQAETRQTDAAIATYNRLLDVYEAKMPLASLRYKLGRIHFDKGELQKASEVWEKLDRDKNSFWAKMADENLKSSKWNDDNKKYLRRLPASAQTESAKEVP